MTEETGNNRKAVPDMLPTDVAERVEAMRTQEETSYKCLDYFFMDNNNCNKWFSQYPPDDQEMEQVGVECRTQMCQWSYQVVDFCQFSRETVDKSMSNFDRFLATRCPAACRALQDRRQFQLAAMTCLYIAIKLCELTELEPSFFSELSQGEYEEREFVEMELKILVALDWRVHGPTRLAFAQHFLALLPPEIRNDFALAKNLMEITRFQTELSAGDYFFSIRNQSSVALACVLNAIDSFRMPRHSRRKYLRSLICHCRMNPFSADMKEIQARLLDHEDLSHMIQCRIQQFESSPSFIGKSGRKRSKVDSRGDSSPVSVVAK